MKKIIIPQRYQEIDYIARATTDISILNMVIKKGFLPISANFEIDDNNTESILNLAKNYVEMADAVILQGGNDISPEFYNQPNYFATGTARFRDLFELEIIKQSLQKKIPILGICRGMQLLNVYFKGNLHQDLPAGKWQKHSFTNSEDLEKQRLIFSKNKHRLIQIQKGGILAKIFKEEKIWINSFHHQEISKLGKSLKVEAIAEDGIIEAFSNQDKKILAIEWHLEMEPVNLEDKKILDFWFSWI
jgi:putative glutamine amidotransferase